LAQAFFLRGGGLTEGEVFRKLAASKTRAKFVEYSPQPFTVHCEGGRRRSVEDYKEWWGRAKSNASYLVNGYQVAKMFEKTCHEFDMLYSKYSFAHWFVGEGLESGEMSECRE
jgi:tubulin alpha